MRRRGREGEKWGTESERREDSGVRDTKKGGKEARRGEESAAIPAAGKIGSRALIGVQIGVR